MIEAVGPTKNEATLIKVHAQWSKVVWNLNRVVYFWSYLFYSWRCLLGQAFSQPRGLFIMDYYVLKGIATVIFLSYAICDERVSQHQEPRANCKELPGHRPLTLRTRGTSWGEEGGAGRGPACPGTIRPSRWMKYQINK